MSDILDFLGPMMPRKPIRPSLPVPHPASGNPPDLMQILAEAATLQPPHPDFGSSAENQAIASIVNNPTPANVPPEELMNAVLQMGVNHGGHGSFPGLTRALIEHLSKANLGALDTEATAQPTLARLLLQGSHEPDMMSLMALDNPSTPTLSNHFFGVSPTDNPDATLAATNDFASRLQSHGQVSKGAHADAIAEDMALDNNLRPTDLGIIDNASPDGMDQLYKLNDNIRMLAMAAQKAKKNPVAASQIINQVINSMAPTYPHRIHQALIDAITESGVGSGRKVSTLDPASMRSLAPDINPASLGYGMLASGQQPDELSMLMDLMGMRRTQPKRNV